MTFESVLNLDELFSKSQDCHGQLHKLLHLDEVTLSLSIIKNNFFPLYPELSPPICLMYRRLPLFIGIQLPQIPRLDLPQLPTHNNLSFPTLFFPEKRTSFSLVFDHYVLLLLFNRLFHLYQFSILYFLVFCVLILGQELIRCLMVWKLDCQFDTYTWHALQTEVDAVVRKDVLFWLIVLGVIPIDKFHNLWPALLYLNVVVLIWVGPSKAGIDGQISLTQVFEVNYARLTGHVTWDLAIGHDIFVQFKSRDALRLKLLHFFLLKDRSHRFDHISDATFLVL